MRDMKKIICCCLAALAGVAPFAAFAGADAWSGSDWLSVPDAPVMDKPIKGETPVVAPGTSWFVCAITNAGEVASARWTTTGLGVYEIYVNGRRIGDDFLKPGFTHYAKTKYSFSYDVTDAMVGEKGESNVFAAEVSSGWWRDKILTPYGHNGFRGRKSAFRGVLDVTFRDGTTRRYGTNATDWKAGIAGPVTLASIYDGEHYDARQEPGFLAWTSFGAPEVNDEFKGEILPTDGAEVHLRRDLTLKPVRAYVWKGVEPAAARNAFGRVRIVREFKDGETLAVAPGETLVVDFGQNCAAVPEFAFSAAAGTVLTAKPAEMLNDRFGLKSRGNDGPGGSVYRVNLRDGHETRFLVRYTFAGGGVETYLPRFTFFGYRYLSITATAPVTISRVLSVPVTSVTKAMERGTIVTGSADVNRLVSNIRWGQLSNYLSVPTDCPQRDERLGWSADTQVFCEAASFNADVYDFLRKWMRDLRDSQDPRGGFPGVAPTAQYGNEAMRVGWADAGVIVPYQMLKQYGDRRIVDENWAAMEKFMARVAETKYRTQALPECRDYQWNDWLSLTRLESLPMTEENSAFHVVDGKRRPKPEAYRYWDYLGGCYWIWDARMMGEMAALTGREADAAKYRQMAEEAKAYVKATFCTKADGTLDALFDGLQTPMLFALKLGLVEGAAKTNTVANLKASFKASGGTLHTGFLGTSIAMDVLTENGMSDLAYDLLFNHKFPGWLYSVDQGATTMWERWNSYTKEKGFGPDWMNSFNHYAYGAVLAWIYKSVAGIAADPSAPGFKTVVMRPVLDPRLGFVKASYPTPHGIVESEWRMEKNGSWSWSFSIPKGMTAIVTTPRPHGGASKPKAYAEGDYTLMGFAPLRATHCKGEPGDVPYAHDTLAK